TGYAYDITATSNLNGAYKGECVANIPGTVNSAKGAPANGGGGGNNHNNSGGGGANLTTGGNGGGNSSSGPTGCNVGNNWGRSGKALSSWSGTKIFMGGGAGAGHANNGSALFNYGGHGGGIIFIWANNLIGNNYSISANGGNGGASQSDGAGGGGAGGTIIMHLSGYTGTATINANGGNGGLSDDGIVSGRCFGGGGGGSGGAVYFTGATPAVTVSITGGAAGTEINRDAGCNAAVPAAAGSNGQIFANYTFPRSTDPAGYCLLLLPVKLITFTASIMNKKVLLQWQIDNPADVKKFVIERSVTASQWTELKAIPGNDQKRDYSTIDEKPLPGRIYYRIKFIEKNNSLSFSPVRHVTTGSNDEFIIYPNPTSSHIIIAGNIKAPADMKLLDVTGKTIFQKHILTLPAEISLPALPAGIYMLNINQSVKKLIIH
ncbi:MAG: T9SS type A sorting domain-containing protein, partial [Bacteroidota bacterium]